MTYTVYFRRADGKGTKTFMTGLNASGAERVKQMVFDRDLTKTMVWVLDENYQMLGDPLDRDPDEAETDRIARAT